MPQIMRQSVAGLKVILTRGFSSGTEFAIRTSDKDYLEF